MNCKDCCFYEICLNAEQKNAFLSQRQCIEPSFTCKLFKDKSKIIELPTDIGTDVYCIATPCGGCSQFDEMPAYENNNACRNCKKREIIVCKFDYDIIPEFGKTVFLTKEEAEKRLKELNNETT